MSKCQSHYLFIHFIVASNCNWQLYRFYWHSLLWVIQTEFCWCFVWELVCNLQIYRRVIFIQTDYIQKKITTTINNYHKNNINNNDNNKTNETQINFNLCWANIIKLENCRVIIMVARLNIFKKVIVTYLPKLCSDNFLYYRTYTYLEAWLTAI